MCGSIAVARYEVTVQLRAGMLEASGGPAWGAAMAYGHMGVIGSLFIAQLGSSDTNTNTY